MAAAQQQEEQPRGFRDGRVIYVGNDAVYGQGVRDRQPDGRPILDSSSVRQPVREPQQQFEGLTPEARYELDTYGVCVLKSVLSTAELDAARAAFDRLNRLSAVDLHGLDHLRSVIAEPAVEALACHPSLLPALVELHRGKPHLVSASPNHKPPVPVDRQAHGGAQLHGGAEFATLGKHGNQDVSVGAEAPGRLHIENCVVFPMLDTVHDGDGGLLIIPGSHKNEFPRPPELFGPYATHYEKGWDTARARGEAGPAGWEGWDWSHVPDGAVNLTPTAGDIVIMREAPTGCLHGVMPWTSTTRQRRTFTMRYKSGREWSSHRDHPDHVHRPVCVDPDIRKRLRLPQQTRLLPETVALVSGDSDALIDFAHSALAAWKHPPVPEHRAPLWRSGRNLSCALPPGGSPLMTAEMRFLMDACGFLHLRAVLSPAEVDAACEEYTEALEDGNIIGKPALEHLVTHPRLLPIYHEFAGENELHCVSMGLLHNSPHSDGTNLQPGHLHCQREYDRYHAEFCTRPSGFGDGEGRISLNNFVAFAYLDRVEADDGGLLVIQGSHKAVFSRPRSLFYPFGNPPGLGGPNRPSQGDWAANKLQIPVPDGCLHVRPKPGDVVVMSETLSHGIRPWSSIDRSRRAMAIRYKAGTAYDEHMAAWKAKEDFGNDALPDWMVRLERQHSGMSFGTRWDSAALRAASAATLDIIGRQTGASRL